MRSQSSDRRQPLIKPGEGSATGMATLACWGVDEVLRHQGLLARVVVGQWAAPAGDADAASGRLTG